MARERIIEKWKYSIFWKRANQFIESMRDNLERKRNMPCVSDAAICAIASIDCLAVYMIGKKSSAQSHQEAAFILKEIKTSDDTQRNRIGNSLTELLEIKAIGQYEDQEPSWSDTEKAVRSCEKIFKFVENELKKAGAIS